MNINLKDKKIYVFDWDGTIFDSMPTKIKNFGKILSLKSGIANNIAEQHYIKYSGNPRNYIFQKFCEIYGSTISDIQLKEMSDNLTIMNKKYLLECKVFDDAINLISHLIKDKKVCISSSVPQIELEFFFNNKLSFSIRNDIKYILGSSKKFSKGRDHINFLKNKFHCNYNEMIMIGDDLADIQLADKANIDSIYINRSNINVYNLNMVNSLDEVINCLQ
jgi:phosphoglycolate phosphatase-like HAD superfamily hydrolase